MRHKYCDTFSASNLFSILVPMIYIFRSIQRISTNEMIKHVVLLFQSRKQLGNKMVNHLSQCTGQRKCKIHLSMRLFGTSAMFRTRAKFGPRTVSNWPARPAFRMRNFQIQQKWWCSVRLLAMVFGYADMSNFCDISPWNCPGPQMENTVFALRSHVHFSTFWRRWLCYFGEDKSWL